VAHDHICGHRTQSARTARIGPYSRTKSEFGQYRIICTSNNKLTLVTNREHSIAEGAPSVTACTSEHKGQTGSYVTVRNNLVYHGNSNGISIGGYSSGVRGQPPLHHRRQHPVRQRPQEHRKRRVPGAVPAGCVLVDEIRWFASIRSFSLGDLAFLPLICKPGKHWGIGSSDENSFRSGKLAALPVFNV
jgi:hypothetical protein